MLSESDSVSYSFSEKEKIVNDYTGTLLNTRHIRSLLMSSLRNGVKFELFRRSPNIKFEVGSPYMDANLVTDPKSGISIDDRVTIHSSLQKPLDSDGHDDYTHGKGVKVVAFIDLIGKCGKMKVGGRFAVLRNENEMDCPGSDPHLFLMTGERIDKIALFFLPALEKVTS